MTKQEFEKVLRAAISGNHNAMDLILKEYETLIINNSVIDGRFDEDCRQSIMLHVALNIHKFII